MGCVGGVEKVFLKKVKEMGYEMGGSRHYRKVFDLKKDFDEILFKGFGLPTYAHRQLVSIKIFEKKLQRRGTK